MRGLLHVRRLSRDDLYSIQGVDLLVPRGLPHPVVHPSARFFLRTVGPMIAPDQRVLVLDCGVGLELVAAASRGAQVVGRDADPRAVEASRANLARAGLAGDVEGGRDMAGGPWDVVLWNPGDAVKRLDDVLAALPEALGDRGRLVVGVRTGSPMEDAARRGLPEDFRVVELARNLGLWLRFRALSIGVDLEARRARRHADRHRTAGDKAAVSRRRWDRGETDASEEEIARVMEEAP